jgi:hypothetical protein
MDNTEKIRLMCEFLYALRSLWNKYAKDTEKVCGTMREQGFSETEIQTLVEQSRKEYED